MIRCGLIFMVALGFFGTAMQAAEKPPIRHESMGVTNGCFVESVVFCDEFQSSFGQEAWVRLLQWGAKEEEETVAGHAVAVFELKGRLWAYDINFGFLPLAIDPGEKENAAKISLPLTARYPRISPQSPLYRYDFPQSPPEEPPHSQAMQLEHAYRDAGLVAEKLALHRPVKLVEFSYLADGETKQSAAVAFMFYGKLCVYFPDKGTIPFTTKTKSVQNLRLLQQCFQRVYAGAFALKGL